MLKSVTLLDAEYQENKEAVDDIPDETDNTATNDEDEHEESSIDEDVFDIDYYSDLLENVRGQFSDFLYVDLIHGVNCVAHCLHLIVKKSVSSCATVESLVTKCRKLAQKLRTPTFLGMLMAEKLKSPILDCQSRWNSIYSEAILTLADRINLLHRVSTVIF